MNFLSLDKNTVVVDSLQKNLIKLLETLKFNVIPIKFSNSYFSKRRFTLLYFRYYSRKLMKILAVITARANSNRLKNKNLKKIKNKSLVEITIDFVFKLKKISDILLQVTQKK